MFQKGQRIAARTGRWALRVSGPVAIVAAMVILFRPGIVPGAGPPPAGRPATAPPQTVVARIGPPIPAGICTDPAFSGCDSYSACAVGVTITSGLAPDPQKTLDQGLQECAAGRS